MATHTRNLSVGSREKTKAGSSRTERGPKRVFGLAAAALVAISVSALIVLASASSLFQTPPIQTPPTMPPPSNNVFTLVLFVGTSPAVQRGAALALGTTVTKVNASELSPSLGDFLVVDLNWLVLQASSVDASGIKAFLTATKPVAFVQAGANVSQQDVDSFSARTGPWPIVMRVFTSTISGPIGNGTTGPDPSRVMIHARLVQMKALPTARFDFQRIAERSELTLYDWSRADLAVRDVFGEVLVESGVMG